ncbi:phosphatidate phosphatase PAH2-like [Bidens hawaiensis]|uniref:phosphatidate phosphatase PAH2-like n=1 Tax=Bidens hawaiensis TaxID=980011 RepID=UPI004049D3DB
MYAVGRLGSYISQGVYTVAGPFHQFGGAVDIVVVQQEDGSLKSSPWYVRFGKFQGVLKAKERVVDVNVNGVDAEFGMYLDPRGEAYFLWEVDSEELVEAVSSRSSSCEDVNGKAQDKLPVKSKSMDCDFDNPVGDVSSPDLSRSNSKGSRVLGFVLGRRLMNENILSKEGNDPNVGRLKRDEIAADLLETRESANCSSESRESRKEDADVTGGRSETSLVLHEQHFVNKDEETNAPDDVKKDVDENSVSEDHSRTQFDDANEPEVGLVTGQGSLEIVPESYAEGASNQEEVGDTNEIRPPLESNCEFQISEPLVDEPLIFEDLDDSNPNISTIEQEVKHGPGLLRVRTYKEHSRGELEGLTGNLRKCASNLEIAQSREILKTEFSRHVKSLPNMCRLDDPIPDNQEESEFYSPIGRFRSNWDLLREDASRLRRVFTEKDLPQTEDELSNNLKDGGPDDGAGGSWSLWPFRRSVPDSSKKVCDGETGQETGGEKDWPSPTSDTHTRELTPAPDQLASLNLTEGQNIVTFTFSTSVLGSQQVDARIYLWSWHTRVVISDVDGTITKSDVLGQFMPLVGRDWSHIGVTHLFSAITENGYQMLYLSARSISQASITRQFLFNLKQDGKALPDGPVVISPDGLFPSLYREVIRRAPHEFKIACLEDIKACFPSDRNPFNAGFGNRDTDEFSYLKVGIPKGKISIINPKGEVVINRCIDSKSYASLHTLVNGIFPPISVHEEREDYNSWNFWKLPPPTMD